MDSPGGPLAVLRIARKPQDSAPAAVPCATETFQLSLLSAPCFPIRIIQDSSILWAGSLSFPIGPHAAIVSIPGGRSCIRPLWLPSAIGGRIHPPPAWTCARPARMSPLSGLAGRWLPGWRKPRLLPGPNQNDSFKIFRH